MELVGEEKRIHALFSEARLADEQTTPSFAGVWNRAQAKTIRAHRAFNLSFVAATALLVCALVSLAWWASYSQRGHQVAVTVPPITNPGAITYGGPKNVEQPGVQNVKEPGSNSVIPRRFSDKSRALKLAATRRQAVLVAANRKAASDANAIESWQSPTATLLDSSSDELLKSLPQLNQTTDELKSFLPSRPK
jgi:hypothetical protein